MKFSAKPLRSTALRTLVLASALAAAPLPTYAETKMPETPSDVKAAPADAAKTASGLSSKVLQAGKGTKKPVATDTVTVHYSGWTTDGKMFDSSVQRGEPTSFPLNGVIKGWTEGLQLMVEGEKRRFWIPADLAYGENPGGGRPGGLLVFDVELISIKEAAKVPEDAEKAKDGTAFKKISPATGEGKPAEGDLVTFQFKAATMDGETVQDTHGEPAPPTAPLDKLPPAMAAQFQDMGPGEKRRIWISEPRAPGGHIVADLELISFKAAPPAPKAPEDVAKAPDDAEKAASGLVSKVLTKGTGSTKPKATDTVEVHYSGWTPDGKLFDSSVQRGETTSFPLNGVIKGWTEGLQLMVEGEKRRFWIPADLAYGENPGGGRPGGLLVFDVELIKIAK